MNKLTGSPSRRNRPDVGKKSVDHGVVHAGDKQVGTLNCNSYL